MTFTLLIFYVRSTNTKLYRICALNKVKFYNFHYPFKKFSIIFNVYRKVSHTFFHVDIGQKSYTATK